MTAFLYKYRVPIGLSLALHLMVFILVFIKMPSKGMSLASAPPAQPAVVQATAVNSAQVSQQIQAIQQQELIRQQHERNAEQQAEAAKQARLKAQADVEKLKAEQEQMKEAQVLRAKELAEITRKAKAEKAKMIAEQKAQEKKILAAKALQKKRELAKKSQELQQKLLANQLAQENNQLNKLQSTSTPPATQTQMDPGLANQYTSKILGAIGDNWIVAPGTSKELKVQYLIHLAPDGTVLSASLVKTSGDPVLDDSAKVAIMKSSPLPVPKNSTDLEIRLTLSPQHVKEMSDATA